MLALSGGGGLLQRIKQAAMQVPGVAWQVLQGGDLRRNHHPQPDQRPRADRLCHLGGTAAEEACPYPGAHAPHMCK